MSWPSDKVLKAPVTEASQRSATEHAHQEVATTAAPKHSSAVAADHSSMPKQGGESTAVQAKLFQSTAVQAKLLQSTMSRTRVPQMSMTRSMMTGPFGHAPSARPSFLMIHHRGSVVPVAGRRVTIAWEDAINQDVTKGSAAIACVIMPCTALGAASLRSDCAGHPASVSSAWKTLVTCPSNNLYNIWRKV